MLPLEEARELAEEIKRRMVPYCTHIQIAGSIRREKPDVKDLELVCCPIRDYAVDLFGHRTTEIARNYLYDAKDWQCDIRWIKPGTNEIEDWPIKPEGKYWRGLICGRVKLDVFLCNPENFGIQYLIRTGSAEFSQRIVTALRYSKNCPVRDGYIHDRHGSEIITPDEQSVFDLLGMEFIEPRNRV